MKNPTEKPHHRLGKKTSIHWETPPEVFKAIEEALGEFTLDVAAQHGTAKCHHYFTPEGYHKTDHPYLLPGTCGLTCLWNIPDIYSHTIQVWCNPPYGGKEIRKWVKKARQEVDCGNCRRAVLLIPSTTEAKHWQDPDGVFALANYVVFWRGRINFLISGEKPKNGNTIGSALAIFGPLTPEEKIALRKLGVLVVVEA